MPQDQEHQGIFTSSFSGLDLSLSNGAVDASASTVFQNCDISADGAIVRRGGTRLLFTLDFTTAAKSWSTVMKTREGTEYVVIVQDGGILITRTLNTSDSESTSIGRSIVKSNVWLKPLTDVNFVLLSAPYDRLLILTGNHPPVEVGFLERTLTYDCIASPAPTDRFCTSPFSANDYFGWQDTNASSTLVWDSATQIDYAVGTKFQNFNVTLNNAATLPVGINRLTLASITWQWWAEAAFYTGDEFNQSVTRANVTKADQNVAVPPELISDYPQILFGDVYTGLEVSSNSAMCADNTYVLAAKPQTALEYNFTAGGVYDYNVAYTPQIAPYFVTFGTTQAVGVLSAVHINRRRLLPFRGNSSLPLNDLRVFINSTPIGIGSGKCLGPGNIASAAAFSTANGLSLYSYVNTATNPLVSALDFMAGNSRVQADAYVRAVDLLGKSYFGALAQAVWVGDLTQLTPTLDGRYVAAYGLGQFCSYLSGNFPALGTVYRNRLILKCVAGTDQLVASANADANVVGEFYNFFQVTGSLKGAPTDPFTFNVAADTKNTVTALSSWQEQLLVFTADNVYAVRGEPFADGTVRSALIASQGAFNNNCVVVSELSVMFMNRYGVFDLINKQNTSDLGVLERSQKVRPLFNTDVASAVNDKLHWLQFDDNTTSLWVGLATANALFTSRHLVLNTTWNSWATFTGAVPYAMRKPVKLYNKTVLFVTGPTERWLLALVANQLHHVDIAVYTNSKKWTDDAVTTTPMNIPFVSTPQKVYRTEMSFMPGARDAEGTNIVKVVSSWANESLVMTPLVPRLTIADLRTTKWLVGNPAAAPVRYLPFVGATSQTPYNTYPQAVPVAVPVSSERYTLLPPTTVDGVVLADVVNTKLRGVVYPSIAASPTFNASTMGRYKRLKRLHLQFDPTAALGSKYNFPGLSDVRLLNMATTAVVTDNRATSRAAVNQALTTQPFVDISQYSASTEAIGNVQHTITLQGFSASYRWFVSSVGAETFKLNGYEFDVEQQRSKTYQRG